MATSFPLRWDHLALEQFARGMGTSMEAEPEHETLKRLMADVASASVMAEVCAATMMWGLVGVERHIGMAALPNSLGRMIQVIETVLPLRVEDAEAGAAVRSWCLTMRGLSQKRNEIVHSIWFGRDGGGFSVMGMRAYPSAQTRTLEDVHLVLEEFQHTTDHVGWPIVGRLKQLLGGPWDYDYRSESEATQPLYDPASIEWFPRLKASRGH